MREVAGETTSPVDENGETRLPGLFVSLLPIVLPVLLISLNTGLGTWAKVSDNAALQKASSIAKIVGDPNFALFLSTLLAMGLLVKVRGLSLRQLEYSVEKALMSGGVIILITAAGGAFGAMLKEAQIGPAIEGLFGSSKASGLLLLTLGFGVASIMKVAQGSGTVSMITTSGMLAAMVPSAASLGFDPVYLATAIGGGSMAGSWMNDSGFWVVSKMSGLTEVETLRTWTILLVILGITAYLVSMMFAMLLPFPLGAPA
jgi:GntP family gluconate:H+ symporter